MARRLGGVSLSLWDGLGGGVPEDVGEYLVPRERLPAIPGVDKAIAALVVVGFVFRVGGRVGG